MSVIQSTVLGLSSLLIVSQTFAASAVCDLNVDKCNGSPLKAIEVEKAIFLRDLVAQKLLSLEASEKAAGRDFKVAFLARKGSNLGHFQPLTETDAQGNLESTDQIINDLLKDAKLPENKSQDSESDSGENNGEKGYGAALSNRCDKSHQLKYSHMGIALKNFEFKDKNGKVWTNPANGEWGVFQLLYSCDDQHSSYVYRGPLSHFYGDHMFDYASEIIVPEQGLQNKIEEVLLKEKRSNNFLQHHYNAAALPNDLNQQNSNQWVLEAVASAMAPAGTINNRQQAQEYLAATGYHGTRLTPKGLFKVIELKFVEKLFAKIMPTICMDSQPNIRKYGIGEIMTVDSVQEYLARMGQIRQIEEVAVSKEDQKWINKNGQPDNTNNGSNQNEQ